MDAPAAFNIDMTAIVYILVAILTATAMAEPPASVVKYESSIPELKMLGHPSPVYTAACPNGLNGELVAFGCLDVCAMLDGYQEPGYQFPSQEMLGTKAHRYVHPSWGIPLYFATESNMRECVSLIESGELIVAYGGWCTAGVEDMDIHFSSPNKAPYRVEQSDGTTVIYFTNVAKTKVRSKPELQEHVANWLDHLGPDEIFDMRGLYVPVLLDDYAGYQPPREGVHYK